MASPLWIARTKFQPPALPADVLPRTTLIETLDAAARSARLVMLSAAAGAGKTTLLASLATHTELPIVWLTIDHEDNDPVRFLFGMIAAVQTIVPEFGMGIAGMLERHMAGGNASVTREDVIAAVGAFINNVIAVMPDAFALILDDLHFVSEPMIYEGLDYLLEHLPPQMHLVIATRYDLPLSLPRLRARRQLFELRLHDLRLTLDETREFLHQSAGLALTDAELAALHEQLQGWAAGLMLLTSAVATSEVGDRADTLHRLTRQRQLTFDFLADEVLNQQAAEIRAFLLETSILDELTPAMCAAVTGKADAAELLERVYHSNLFLSRIDHATYRYHDLFAEFLGAQAKREIPERIRDMHLRAAHAETLPGRAIQHFIAAEAWDEAAGIMEQYGEQLVMQGMQATLSGWLKQIPETVYAEHLRLLYLRGMAALAAGEAVGTVGMDAIFDQSLRDYEQLDDRENITASLCALASLAFTQARFEECSQLVERALISPARVETRVTLLMLQASVSLFVRSDWDDASERLREAIRQVRESGSNEALLMVAMYLGQEFTVLPGALDLLEGFCRETLEAIGGAASPVKLGIEDVLAYIELQRGNIEEAIRIGQSALALKEQLGGFPFLGLNAKLTLATMSLIRKDEAGAEAYLNAARDQLRQLPLNRVLVNSAYFARARLLWQIGRFDEARRIYEQMRSEDTPMRYVEALRRLLGGMLDMAANRYEAAERQLMEAVEAASYERLARIYATPEVWLAALYDRWKRPEQALTVFDALLAECEARSTPGAILQEGAIVLPLLRLAVLRGKQGQYARTLLDALGEPLAVRTAKSIAGLTGREIEVVTLIAEGASNRGIAEALFISETTAKTHVANIMNKLGVSSRTEIIAQARRLGVV